MQKVLNGNLPKWISLIIFIVGFIVYATIFYMQTELYAATVEEHNTALECLDDKMQSIDRRLYRIELKLELEDKR